MSFLIVHAAKHEIGIGLDDHSVANIKARNGWGT